MIGAATEREVADNASVLRVALWSWTRTEGRWGDMGAAEGEDGHRGASWPCRGLSWNTCECASDDEERGFCNGKWTLLDG